MYYLYVKTHNKTGLRYLGKTIQDPYTYKGSGVRWENHINKHGYDVSTYILLATDNFQELSETGMFFSKLFNIVQSDEWANLIPESGTGGHIMTGKKHTNEAKIKMSKASKGRLKSEEHKLKIALSNTGKFQSEQKRRKISESRKGKPATNKGVSPPKYECEHCGKFVSMGNHKRWHGENCKTFNPHQHLRNTEQIRNLASVRKTCSS